MKMRSGLCSIFVIQFLIASISSGQSQDADARLASSLSSISSKASESILSRYQPAADGFRIVGGQEIFNRTLYGGHAQDDLQNRYYTFAGDQPLVMGAIVQTIGGGNNAKCGTLMLGVSQSRGEASLVNKYGAPSFGMWLHECRDTISTFCNGWYEYRVKPFLVTAPEIDGVVEVLPLNPEDGFLVHVKLTAQGRVNFCAAFGGITDYVGLITNHGNKARNFAPSHCRGNVIDCGKNRASVEGPKSKMWIGTNFASEVSIGDAAAAQKGPGPFLGRETTESDVPMARIAASIAAGETLDGFIVVLRNQNETALDRWLARNDPVGDLKRVILEKQQALVVETPDPMLNLTIPANVVGMDACWNKNVFCHGATNWHSPYLGWRLCYGPTVLGWHDRVVQHFLTHADPARFTVDKEHGDAFISSDLHGRGFGYNMQEVAVDMLLHNLEWTGDIEVARNTFDRIAQVLRFETRTFDPDDNGLYQSFLNTWISDGHPYNGGNCTQASAYNYRANRVMALIAAKLGRDAKPFVDRAEKINRAAQKILWLPENGVFAEYKDTIGNQLIHPSPELATIYHSIECGLADPFQAYQMLRFTRTDLRNEATSPRQGRLSWSSNWYPRNFCACGLYPGENIHLAWAYFQNGQTAEAMDLLRGVVDAHFMGDVPGTVAHNLNGTGMSDGSPDFTDTVSMYLRLVVEGLFGIRLQLLENRIQIAPSFPAEWDHASLQTKEFSLKYVRHNRDEQWEFRCDRPGVRFFKLPMRGTTVEAVTLDGQPVKYRIEPAIGRSNLIVETPKIGAVKLRLVHGAEPLPTLKSISQIQPNQQIALDVRGGTITEVKDPSGALANVKSAAQRVDANCIGKIGPHSVFVRVHSMSWDGWLPVDFAVVALPPPSLPEPKGIFQPVDISSHFNSELTAIHQLDYATPRPAGMSLMTNRNGRYGWDDNNLGGPRTVKVDDSQFRNCGGTFTTPRGIPFATPGKGRNVACVSIWDNFPKEITIPLSGRATELATLLIGVTNPMQSRVENGRLTVHYEDGSKIDISLINPKNFDDWLVAATQRENGTVQFSDFNHAIVQRIVLDPTKPLKSLVVRGTANEVIVGVLGVAIQRP